ncbi:MAG: hypothetical protein AB8B82_11965 [Roseovarius sp.]
MRARILSAPLVGLLFSLCLTEPATAQSVPVTGAFNDYRHEWPQNSGALEVRWRAVTQGDQVLICGAVRHINPRAKKANRGLLRKGWIKVGDRKGTAVLRDLSHFTDLRDAPFKGAAATCRVAKPGYAANQLILGFDAHSGYDADMGMF